MARIRTIKPELPQSESMGRVSRDARLLFILLWTLCDDAGRTRAASRMLASLLYPYDDDAPGLIDAWLVELEEEGCILRYSVEGSAYLQVCKWLIHQKIDRPSASKIPAPAESSRVLASPRESSSVDLDLRTKDLDQGEAPPTSFAIAQEVAPPEARKAENQGLPRLAFRHPSSRGKARFCVPTRLGLRRTLRSAGRVDRTGLAALPGALRARREGQEQALHGLAPGVPAGRERKLAGLVVLV